MYLVVLVSGFACVHLSLSKRSLPQRFCQCHPMSAGTAELCFFICHIARLEAWHGVINIWGDIMMPTKKSARLTLKCSDLTIIATDWSCGVKSAELAVVIWYSESSGIQYLGVSLNGGTPKSSILIGFFHYKPSILGYHYVWKHPYFKRSIFKPQSLWTIFHFTSRKKMGMTKHILAAALFKKTINIWYRFNISVSMIRPKNGWVFFMKIHPKRIEYSGIWVFPKIVGFPSKSSLLIGFSIIFTIQFGVFPPNFWKHPYIDLWSLKSQGSTDGFGGFPMWFYGRFFETWKSCGSCGSVGKMWIRQAADFYWKHRIFWETFKPWGPQGPYMC